MVFDSTGIQKRQFFSFLDEISESIDSGKKTSARFIDMTKAFDRVEHSTLLITLFVWFSWHDS